MINSDGSVVVAIACTISLSRQATPLIHCCLNNWKNHSSITILRPQPQSSPELAPQLEMLHFHLIEWKPCGCESPGSVSASLTGAHLLYSISCATVQIDGRAHTSFPDTEAMNFLRLQTFPLLTSYVLEAGLFLFFFIFLTAIVWQIVCRQTRHHPSPKLLLTALFLSAQAFSATFIITHAWVCMYVLGCS